MRPLTVSELLLAWDRGRDRSSTERVLLLLAAACPDEDADALAALPIGCRDARLLALRQWTFGERFTGLTRCPTCAERIELRFNAADVRAGAPTGSDREDELAVEAAGYRVRFRLPDSRDVDALHGSADAVAARRDLLGRCLLGAVREGKAYPVKRLPASVLAAVVQRMGEMDPHADVHTTVTCPACAHRWQATFDIVSFFWTEIETWATRMLYDVHVLASAYAWSEAEILALSPGRRQLYLEMVGA